MRDFLEYTPPSSVNQDEITNMDGEHMMDLEELPDDFEEMEEVTNLEEEEDTEIPEDLAVTVFRQHTGSVFCGDLHASGKYAVTGGEDDRAFVWAVDTGDIIMECKGHKDSVVFVGFSFDGAFLATVDMGGVIKVWKCNFENTQQEWPIAFEYESDDLSWGLWHFGARVLLCGGSSGDIFIFKIPSGETKILHGHHSKTECATIFKDGVRLAAGYEDGTVNIWDLKTNSVIHQMKHTVPPSGGITAIDTHPDDNLVASISHGMVGLMTSANGRTVAELDTENELETVAFSDSQLGYFAVGTLKGSVTIWDAGRQMIRHQCMKPEDDEGYGVTKLFWVKDQLVTACLDGAIRIYQGQNGQRTCKLTGHLLEILDLCYNEKEKIFLSTSEDYTARIFKFDYSEAQQA